LVTYMHLMRDLKISLEDQILKLNEWQEKYHDIMFGVWLCMDCAYKHKGFDQHSDSISPSNTHN